MLGYIVIMYFYDANFWIRKKDKLKKGWTKGMNSAINI